MNKEHILAEIKRSAALNGGVALGMDRFFQETGIKANDWIGKIWARWRDAVSEMGFSPNELQGCFDDNHILEKYALFVRKIQKVPVVTELRLEARLDKSFPSHTVFERFGGKQVLIEKLIEFCEAVEGFDDVRLIALPLLKKATEENTDVDSGDDADEVIDFIYMLKAGRYFKVGRSNSFDRRSRELKIQLPEQAETVHVIRTDDPVGIELYWRRRFESKRKNGEWFELSAQDVKVFKRRKFM